jgi:rare lipoprotein A
MLGPDGGRQYPVRSRLLHWRSAATKLDRQAKCRRCGLIHGTGCDDGRHHMSEPRRRRCSAKQTHCEDIGHGSRTSRTGRSSNSRTHLDPILTAAGIVAAVSGVGDHSLKAHLAGTFAHPRAHAPGMYRTLFVILLSSLIASSDAQAESGLASFYGGRGGGMTCAHRTRPMGSVVTVTTRSGRSIQCRVNDRGPFIRGRIIDVSVSAALALGMMGAGVVAVSVQ